MAIEWILLSDSTPEAVYQETGDEWFLTYNSNNKGFGIAHGISLWDYIGDGKGGKGFLDDVTHWAVLTTPDDAGGE